MSTQERVSANWWSRVPRPRSRGESSRAERGVGLRRTVSVLLWVIIIPALIFFWPAKLGGSFSMIIVAGDSMEPTMSIGDLALTWKKANPEVGDVLVYQVPEGGAGAGISVIHRIVSIEDGVYKTHGDNREFPDHWEIREENIIGVTKVVVPGIGRLLVGPFLAVITGVVLGIATLLFLWPGEKDEEFDEERDEEGAEPEGFRELEDEEFSLEEGPWAEQGGLDGDGLEGDLGEPMSELEGGDIAN